VQKEKTSNAITTAVGNGKFSSFFSSLRNLTKNYMIFIKNKKALLGFSIICFFVIIAVFAPYIATENPYSVITQSPPFAPPNSKHFLGTDEIGRDVFSMLVYGSRASLIVGIVASLVTIILGASLGLIAGYFGKIVDFILMRLADLFLVIPDLLLMLVLTTILVDLKILATMGEWGPLITVIIVIGIVSWPRTARVVRAQVLSVKERAFVERARTIGSSDFHIILKHIFPNVFPLVFANAMLSISYAIFMESYLSFLGLTSGTFISWGMMLKNAWDSVAVTRQAWWYILPPGICIVLVVLAFSLFGYALEEVLNPKLRKVY